MFGLENISIDFQTGSGFFVWSSLVILLALAVYLYLRTNPPLPRYLRIILGALRAIAILALITVLLEPVISYTRDYQRKPSVALLLDESGSMDKVESNLSRNARRDSLLSSNDFDRLQSSADIHSFYFAGNLTSESDKIQPDRTALGDALDAVRQTETAQPYDYWLVLTDGRSNSGVDPRKAAAGIGDPVIAVDLASEVGSFDVGIDDIEYNPILFAGQPAEMKLKLSWQGADDKNFAIRLLDSNRVVFQTEFNPDQPDGLGETTLKYTPMEPGQKILKVSVSASGAEQNSANNQKSFSVKVLKSRLMVLIATERPDYEVGFLKRLLEQSDKYEVDLIATGSKAGNLAGQFPATQSELNRYDLVVLHDPDPRKLESRQDLLSSYLSEKGGSILALMGEQFCARGPVDWFNRLLPFSQSQRQPIEYRSFHGSPSEGQLFHPSVRLADTQTEIRKLWADLPPFQAIAPCDSINPQSTVLAWAALTGRDENRLPILGYRRFGPGKLMASAASPFWTWGFVNLGFGEDDASYRKFVEGTISWLTVSDDLDPVRIKPDKDVYHRGETIRFEGFAFDLGFRPIPGVTGTVRLEDPSQNLSYEADLIDRGEGKHTAELYDVVPGQYRFIARFEAEGRQLKRAEGKILVEPFSLEQANQSGDPATLAAMASLTGGQYFRFDSFDKAIDAINMAPVTVSSSGDIAIFNKFWLLIIFLAALSVEWLLRKIHQLL
ncbi:MAG: hypothetical protein AB1483_04945 [Candidatus Zixiibacteriota bacterium]